MATSHYDVRESRSRLSVGKLSAAIQPLHSTHFSLDSNFRSISFLLSSDLESWINGVCFAKTWTTNHGGGRSARNQPRPWRQTGISSFDSNKASGQLRLGSSFGDTSEQRNLYTENRVNKTACMLCQLQFERMAAEICDFFLIRVPPSTPLSWQMSCLLAGLTGLRLV